MDFGKLKDLAAQTKEKAANRIDAAKDSMQGITESAKQKMSSFSMDDVTNRMAACQQYFSESELLQKLTKVAKSAGAGLIYPVLLLFDLLKSAEVDNSQKMMILGALGYFILPLDLIPDALPVEGFADDLAALTFTLKACAANISKDMQQQAKQQLHEWLGEYNESLTNGVDKLLEMKLPKK